MKILILLFFAFSGQVNLSAQPGLNAKSPVFLKAPAQSAWQVSQAIKLENNILLVGQSKTVGIHNKMLLLITDYLGKTEWVKEYPYPPVRAVAAINKHSVALLNVSGNETMLTRLNFPQGEVAWQIPLGKMQRGSLAAQPDGSIAVATENNNYTLVTLFSESGKKNWALKLSKLYTDPGSISKITGLADGTYAVAGGGKVWGVSENGQILWQFSSKAEHINWQSIKQTQNGEIVVAGTSMNLADAKTDIHIWGIARDGNKIAWANLIGEDETQDKVNDFVELTNGELLFLCREDNKNQLIKLNHEHQPEVIYTTENDENYNLKHLLANQNQSFTLIGNSFNGNNQEIVFQNFESATSINQPKKSSLFLLSIGVSTPDLHYVRNDAEAISNLYRQQAGKIFQKVFVKTLTDYQATKAGELAKAFESLSMQAIKNEDLTIVYFSGNGQALSDDYLLHASDFNAATLRSTTIRLSQLVHDLDNLPGKKLIILDACQSGAAQNLSLPKNISVLTSSTAQQSSFEDAQWQHGAFTKVFVDSMRDKNADINADGYISLVELYQYTAKVLPILTKKDKNKTQTPILLHKGDDFIVFE